MVEGFSGHGSPRDDSDSRGSEAESVHEVMTGADHVLSNFNRLSVCSAAGGWSRARFLIVPLFCLLPVSLMSGCSGNEEEQKEPSAVEQMTDSAAQEAVDSIRLPMQKAQQVQALQDAYLKSMDEAVESGGR